MKKKYLLVTITAAITVCLICFGMIFFNTDYTNKNIKVGFVYIGDRGTPLFLNLIKSLSFHTQIILYVLSSNLKRHFRIM